MCLKFDPEENTLKQTCSGKCKNRCGFKLDDEQPSSMKARKVHINKRDKTSDQLKDTPVQLRNSSLDREIIISSSTNII